MSDRDFDPCPIAKGALGGRPSASNNVKTTVLQQVALQSELSTRTVWELLHGRRKMARFVTVDKLISNWLGRPDLWQQEPLNHYYQELAGW